MSGLIRAICDRWLIWALLASALMLATAHAFETFGGYAPCTLCLRQREVYWAAGWVAAAGIVLSRLPRLRPYRWTIDGLLAVVFLIGVVVAAYHAGAEWKWWPGPTQCSGGGETVSLDSLSALANGTAKIKPPACDEAAWRFAGLSMAGWNVLVSLKLVFWSLMALRQDRVRP